MIYNPAYTYKFQLKTTLAQISGQKSRQKEIALCTYITNCQTFVMFWFCFNICTFWLWIYRVHFDLVDEFNPKKTGGGWNPPIGQEIACHFWMGGFYPSPRVFNWPKSPGLLGLKTWFHRSKPLRECIIQEKSSVEYFKHEKIKIMLVNILYLIPSKYLHYKVHKLVLFLASMQNYAFFFVLNLMEVHKTFLKFTLIMYFSSF